MTAQSNRMPPPSGGFSNLRAGMATSSRLDRTRDSRQRIASGRTLSRTAALARNDVELVRHFALALLSARDLFRKPETAFRMLRGRHWSITRRVADARLANPICRSPARCFPPRCSRFGRRAGKTPNRSDAAWLAQSRAAAAARTFGRFDAG